MSFAPIPDAIDAGSRGEFVGWFRPPATAPTPPNRYDFFGNKLQLGIGYTRDTGPEKQLRDQNMLKLMSGGTREIHSFLAGWTGAHA